MKIVHSWLNDLAPVGDDVDAVAELITNLGLAVEDVARVGGSVAGVITARVLRTERHPGAAKVHRVFVDAGDGVERHVWCGAFNMHPGDVIPLATPGTAMPDGRSIEPKPILGLSSDGMLCSASELGLGNDHSGILILPVGTPLGVPYGEALGIGEVVYDLDVLRNRPDCYGHLGVAATWRPSSVWRSPPLPCFLQQHCRREPQRSSSLPASAAHVSPRWSSVASPSVSRPTGCAGGWRRRACGPSTTWSTSATT